MAKWFVFFFCNDPDFLKKEVKTYLMAPMSSLNLPIFCYLHTYSLWLIQMFVSLECIVN